MVVSPSPGIPESSFLSGLVQGGNKEEPRESENPVVGKPVDQRLADGGNFSGGAADNVADDVTKPQVGDVGIRSSPSPSQEEKEEQEAEKQSTGPAALADK